MTIDYTPATSGISTGQIVQAAQQLNNYTLIQSSINSNNDIIDDNTAAKESMETIDYVRAFDTTSISTGSQSITIAAGAVTVYDASTDAEVSGWGAKTLSGLTLSTTGYIWCTYVSGAKDYEASYTTAALPADITEKYLIGNFSVDGAGVVTEGINYQKIYESGSNYYRDKQYFLDDVDIKGDINIDGSLTLDASLYALPIYYHDAKITYTSANTITIPASSAVRDGINSQDITFASPVVIDLSASGVNGLDTGSEASSTWYYVYAIYNPTTDTAAGLLSVTNEADTGTITLPPDYTKKRQLKIEVYNGSGDDILKFVHYDQNKINWVGDSESTLLVLNGGNATSYTDIDCTSLIPPTSQMGYFKVMTSTTNDARREAYLRTNGESVDMVAISSRGTGTVARAKNNVAFFMATDSSQLVEYKTDTSGTTLDTSVLGYVNTEVK